ncbi:MAG: hypothetical protein HY903_00725 [Deltaproteobacteria bacterium]|nr:hypothetical protein [Deltaproteobacteria bacterium]
MRGWTSWCSMVVLAGCGGGALGGGSADLTVCGDGEVVLPELCDDGNDVTEVACEYGVAHCRACSAACDRELELEGPVCGDGVKDAAEACDDGDGDACDGCLDDCTLHVNVCGDGARCGAELCDDGNDVNGDGCSVGCDHQFESIGRLVPADRAAEQFFGVDVQIDGDVIVVGKIGTTTEPGSAYVFTRDPADPGRWSETLRLRASDGGAEDGFGGSLALSGTLLAVGAHAQGGNRGAVYLYDRNRGGANRWGLVKKIVASDAAAGDFFGTVDLAPNTLVVGAQDHGAGAVYVYKRNAGGTDNWGEAKILRAADGVTGDRFGVSVSLSGALLAVGASSVNQARGAAYVFGRDTGGAGQWGQLKKVTAADGAPFDNFGLPVSLSGDVLVVGASLAPRAYVYAQNQGGTNAWGQLTALDPPAGEAGEFGGAVAAAGPLVLVGDPVAAKRTHAFSRNLGGANHFGANGYLARPGGDSVGTLFGYAVAVDHGVAVVADCGEDNRAGGVYLFEVPETP